MVRPLNYPGKVEQVTLTFWRHYANNMAMMALDTQMNKALSSLA